jgi:hypothetical protein
MELFSIPFQIIFPTRDVMCAGKDALDQARGYFTAVKQAQSAAQYPAIKAQARRWGARPRHSNS